MWDYERIREALRDETLPAMLVDLGALERNVARVRAVIEPAGKKLRLATKSVRVPALIRRILDAGGPGFQGLMCYSSREALHLMKEGFDDFLIAYPTVAADDLEALRTILDAGKKVALIVDELAHIEAIESHWTRRGGGPGLPVCIDVDMSFRPLGDFAHLGVRRSPLFGIEDVAALVGRIEKSKACCFAGFMAYEAQIAGVADRSPFARLKSVAVRVMKRLSGNDVRRRREKLAAWASARGLRVEIFNGGGTGSLGTAAAEPWLTEVTAGSGFLQSHLFDYYRSNRNEPAMAFAMRVTRIPGPGYVTCHSGGFVASGSPGPDRQPLVWLPAGLMPLPDEGFGEVQTPFRLPSGLTLHPGDPVLARPAKAGEIAEHFSHYVLLREGSIADRVPTYRGQGCRFF